MGDPFALELKSQPHFVELRYPLSAAVYVVVTAVVCLGLLSTAVGSSPGLRRVWLGMVDVTIVGVAFSAVWLVWISTVRFDFARDQVRRGFMTIGKTSDIASVEPSSNERAALQLVFRDDRRNLRRWRIPGVREHQAALLGPLLAEELHVPFHHPMRPGG